MKSKSHTLVGVRVGHSLVPVRILAVGAFTVLAGAGETALQTGEPEPWVAPSRAARKQNPEHADAYSIEVGRLMFVRECVVCHGKKGLGDGPKAADLDPRPANLARPTMWDESDGALCWKLTEGKFHMPATKARLSDDERWHVINYVRTLAPPEAAPTEPRYAMPEAHRRAISAMIRAYEPVRAALAGTGDGPAAARALPALAGAAAASEKERVDDATIPEAARSDWREDAAACAAAVDALKNSGDDVARLRTAFRPLSTSMIRAVERYGHDEAGPVFVFVGTSAGSGEAPLWIQTDPKGQDPYSAPAGQQAPRKRLASQRRP